MVRDSGPNGEWVIKESSFLLNLMVNGCIMLAAAIEALMGFRYLFISRDFA